jgi:hypothetical protein
MAWRIDKAVIRGELDNRVRGCVTGRIWFVGKTEPMLLELAGNGWRDLAGRRLEFTNPEPRPMDLDDLAWHQKGMVGDITASRRVKVPDIPPEQIGDYYTAKKPFPWHWGNSLYLEWFSERNGRVVIETVAFDLKVAGEPAWEMSEDEETDQRKANSAALTDFMDRLAGAAGGTAGKIIDDTPAEWEARPQTEEEAEAMQARSERLADCIETRLRREGEQADYEQILEEEIDRLHREEGRPEPTPEQLARNAGWIEDMNRAAGEALANPDPEVEKEMEFEHPLVKRVTEFSLQLRNTAKAGGWRPKSAGNEHPVCELLDATMIAGPKLAGALNGQYWPPEVDFCAHTIVRLKRARGYLEDALRATESCQEEKLIKPEHLGPISGELIDFIRDTDELIAELRTKLERGTD